MEAKRFKKIQKICGYNTSDPYLCFYRMMNKYDYPKCNQENCPFVKFIEKEINDSKKT
jgi:predicted DNA-binding transcriptional regulator AlpA